MPTKTTYAPYAWILTYDHLDHKRDNTHGPRNINPALEVILKAAVKLGRKAYYAGAYEVTSDNTPQVEWFRIYDGDDELYYTGVRIGEGTDDGSEDGFEPLDDWGTPNAGATRIDYYQPATDAWVQL